MAAIRAIGSIISTLLSIVLIVFLITSLILLDFSNFITEENVNEVVSSIMNDEEVQEEVANTVTASSSLSFLPPETIKAVMRLSSVQNVTSSMVSGMIADTIADGGIESIDIAKSFADTLVSDPEAANAMSKEVSALLMNDKAVQEKITEVVSSSEELSFLPKETVAEFMAIPAVQETVADLAADILVSRLSQEEGASVDVSGRINQMLKSDPTTFDATIDKAMGESNVTYDSFYNGIKQLADEAGEKAPTYGISNSELLIYALDLKSDEVNAAFGGLLNEEVAEDSVPEDGAGYGELTGDYGEATGSSSVLDDALAQAGQALSVLQSPLFPLAIVIVALVFFAVFALVTWSFRLPFLFTGICGLVTGGILFGLSCVTFATLSGVLVSYMPADVPEIVMTIIASIWDSFMAALNASGTLCLTIGGICIATFIILHIFRKRAKKV